MRLPGGGTTNDRHFRADPSPGFANPANDTSAACAGAPNPAAWFPDPTDDYSAAAAECVACPIVASCGDWAMVHKQSGLWGGALLERGKPVGAPRRWKLPRHLAEAVAAAH